MLGTWVGWAGALLIIGGVVFVIVQPMRRGQMSGGRLGGPEGGDTLEPRTPARGIGFRAIWPGLALIALGALLLLGGTRL